MPSWCGSLLRTLMVHVQGHVRRIRLIEQILSTRCFKPSETNIMNLLTYEKTVLKLKRLIKLKK